MAEPAPCRDDLLEVTLSRLERQLLWEATPQGWWEGRLASSALATAIAVTALRLADRDGHAEPIRRGLDWLADLANGDGGWGDSPESRSNLSTTLLAWSALHGAGGSDYAAVVKAERWLEKRLGDLAPDTIRAAVLAYYGDDRTFSAPIVLMLTLNGRLGAAPQCWWHVPQLPLELAALPHQLFRWLRLPVVSYAIPALIAIGLVRHRQAPSRWPWMHAVRGAVTGLVLRRLERIQPATGGFLEAIPLTAFVVMSLVASRLAGHPVVTRGVRFLLEGQREDGSWPIDTHLATWVTTLSVKALDGPGAASALPDAQRGSLARWLLDQQLRREHPFTHAAPGGWSWTPLSGGVPDADDTAGALLALATLEPGSEQAAAAAAAGVRWLLDLQNSDGGVPTFCRGWGTLPFDRSCPDITAHALRAAATWRDRLPPRLASRCERAIGHGLRYLNECQSGAGSWLPLWFGNQWAEDQRNPVYGTAQVLMALRHPELARRRGVAAMAAHGRQWLVAAQNRDGGWGAFREGISSVEETALALDVLAGGPETECIARGQRWLLHRLDLPLEAAPIGLYFASLWYSEKLYPLIFATAALRRLAAAARAKGRMDHGR